ncbi:MAG: hypothetical protein QXW80_06680 [Candidatus Micrarchaeia archaeon]
MRNSVGIENADDLLEDISYTL